MMIGVAVVGAVLLGGCGRDPILDRADELAAAPGVAPDPVDPGPPPPPRPDDPAPVPPDDPAPVAPDDPVPGVPEQPDPSAGLRIDGPSVVLSGVVAVESWGGGTVRVDVFDGDQEAAAGQADVRPSVVAVARLDAPGPFEVRVPASAGHVWVGAFVDEDGDGRPGPGDASGWYPGNPVTTEADHTGLAVSLAVHADRGP